MARQATRSWTISPNNVFTDQTDLTLQFQEVLIAIKQTFVAAGWTVRSSSNGVVADTNDNWNTTADIAFGTWNYTTRAALTGAASWIVLRAPASFVAAGGGPLDVLLSVNDNTVPYQIAPLQLCSDGYDLLGTTAALPGRTAANETTQLTSPNFNVLPWDEQTNGRWTSWYTSRGDIMFGVKQSGNESFQMFWFLGSNENSDGGGNGSFRWYYGGASLNSGTTNVLSNPYSSSLNWRGHLTDGTDIAPILLSEVSNLASIHNGIDESGQMRFIETRPFITSAANVRDLGSLMGGDVAVGLEPQPFGVMDDTEDQQTLRRVYINGFWVYWPTASLPIQ